MYCRQPGYARIVITVAAYIAATFFITCVSNSENKKKGVRGKTLASQYCQSCHLLPDPSLLTKEKWGSSVLPVMGLYLGMGEKPVDRSGPDSEALSVLPLHPAMDTADWQLIKDYYTTTAPEVMPPQQRIAPAAQGLPFFTVLLPPAALYGTVSVTSYVKIDTTVQPHRVLAGNAMTNELMVLNNRLQPLQSSVMDGALVDLNFDKGKILACIIGKEVIPNNRKEGKITGIAIAQTGTIKADTKPLFDSLARPVQITKSDINSDGKDDYIICGFGNLTGELFWMESKGNGSYTRHILRSRPGALRTYVQDANGDGLPDIWAQFAQGEEGIFLYTNKGGGAFEERQVLRFPPSYGSTYFELADCNGDGIKDIVYTCGDNADYSQILKPYHGVYIFINDGKSNFHQQYFYPVNGCYKAMVKDFDGDGDPDIAAISFFPAAITPWEAFVYLENKGSLHFQPYTLPAGIPFQKGVTMDAGDIDGDGRMDIVLGSGYFTSNPTSEKQPLVILLKGK